jgi:hypothetical protein
MYIGAKTARRSSWRKGPDTLTLLSLRALNAGAISGVSNSGVLRRFPIMRKQAPALGICTVTLRVPAMAGPVLES